MFGILRPCRHTLSAELAGEWMSHLCGLCLALRDGHGQAARLATNHDGLVVSALTAAQTRTGTRTAGPCLLRDMRTATVAEGAGAELAAVVSLLLASARINDHIEDGDGRLARTGVRELAGRTAERWQRGARASGAGLGFDGTALTAVVDRQRAVEKAAGEGTDVLGVTAPTEEATAEAFAHTAFLAGRPANAEPLHEAGRLFGRIAHLLDAVEDRNQDLAQGSWNPLTNTGTPIRRARDLCDDAVLGVSLAVDEADFDDGCLVHALLVLELGRAVERTFAHAGHPGHPGQYRHSVHGNHPGHSERHGGSHGPAHAGGPHSGGEHRSGGGGGQGSDRCDCGCRTPALEPRRSRGLPAGCAAALFMCCTCQFCCRDPHPGPWSGKPRGSWCEACSCWAECCSCCD